MIEVLKPMQWSLGDIIQAFKATCTSFWQEQHGYDHSSNRPITVDCYTAQAPTRPREKAAMHTNEGSLIRVLSKRQRQNIRQVINKPLSLSFLQKT